VELPFLRTSETPQRLRVKLVYQPFASLGLQS